MTCLVTTLFNCTDLTFCPFFVVSELQEEGINAINLPLSPSHYELDPEDTMLGKLLHTAPVAKIQTHLLNSI